MPTPLQELIEKVLKEFDIKFGGATGYCNPVFSKKIQDFIEKSLLSVYQKTLEIVEKGLPEKCFDLGSEAEDTLMYSGGFNSCLSQVRESIDRMKKGE